MEAVRRSEGIVEEGGLEEKEAVGRRERLVLHLKICTCACFVGRRRTPP